MRIRLLLLLGSIFLFSACEDNSFDNARADYSLSRAKIYQGDSIQFSDQSTNEPSAWSWVFEGGSPETSSKENPLVIYDTPGEYDVFLTAINGESEVNAERFDQIKVLDNSIPPYAGSVWLERTIVTDEDPTTFASVDYITQEIRPLHDREDGVMEVETFVYEATYEGGQTVEILVHPEFGKELADTFAMDYAWYLGQLPSFLIVGVKDMHVSESMATFAATYEGSILVPATTGINLIENGFIQEVLIHEAGHTTLNHLDEDPGYLAAAAMDPTFISTYAENNAIREDVAETILTYLALRYKSDRLSETMAYTINALNANRNAFFDTQNFAMYPWE
ncbi:MAG: PKD domain-containing protein [Bacteroidota bacterium]